MNNSEQNKKRSHKPTISLQKIASTINKKYDLEQKLKQDLTLEEFLALVSTSVHDFMDQILSRHVDINREIFAPDTALKGRLQELYADPATAPNNRVCEFYDKLRQSMRYSLLSSGKMMRPALVFIIGTLFNAKTTDLLIASMAVEAIHTYSLIHDDLPSMDNDDYRRGKLTNHKVFGQAHAILAGDSLQTLAFKLLSANLGIKARQAMLQIQTLAYGAGHYGMCLGQSYDLISESLTPEKMTKFNFTRAQAVARLTEIHYRKTGFLIRSSCLLGFYASEFFMEKRTANLISEWAYSLGLAYQIKDDLLDVEGDEQTIGKPVGSDVNNHKLTYVSLLGLEATKKEMDDQLTHIQDNLQKLEMNLEVISKKQQKDVILHRHAISWLHQITDFVVNRDK